MASSKSPWRIDGDAVRARRTERGMTKAQLARIAGLSERALTNIELGRSPGSSESARTLATMLELPIERVLVREGAPEKASPAAASAATPEATVRAPPPIATSTGPAPKLPERTRLDFLADLERERGIDPPPVRVRGESIDVLTAIRLQCAFATHALFDGHRFVVDGTLDGMRAVSVEAEARAIGAPIGIGTRFHLLRDIVPGEPMSVTAHATTRKIVAELHAKMKREVRLVVRLVVVSERDERVISLFASERKRAWGLVVERVLA